MKTVPDEGQISYLPNSKQEVLWTVALIAAVVISTASVNFNGIPEGQIYSKIHAFNCVSAIAFVLLSLRALRDKIRLKFDFADLTFLAYALYILVQYYLFNSTYDEKLTLVLTAFFWTIALKNFLNLHPEKAPVIRAILLLLLLLSGTIEAIYGQLQLLNFATSNNSHFVVTGSFHNPSPFAIFLSTIFLASLATVLTAEKTGGPVNRLVLYISRLNFLLISMILPATQSRTAWIIAGVGSVGVLIYKYRRNLVKRLGGRYIYLAILLMVVLTISGLVFSRLYSFKRDSADGRRYIWNVSFNAVQDKPLFGLSFNQFRYKYGAMHIRFQQNQEAGSGDTGTPRFANYAMNDFIQVAVETGIIGLCLFTLVIFLPFARGLGKLYQSDSAEVLIPVLFLLSIVISAQFTYTLQLLPHWLIFIFAYVFLTFDMSTKLDLAKAKTVSNCTLISIVTVGLLVLAAEARVIQAKRNWHIADINQKVGNWHSAKAYYKRALTYKSAKPEILQSYGKVLFDLGDTLGSLRALEAARKTIYDPYLSCNLGNTYKALGNYQRAESEYCTAILMAPDKMYPRYLLAKLYHETSQDGKARRAIKETLNMRIRFPSKATATMQEELRNYMRMPRYFKLQE